MPRRRRPPLPPGDAAIPERKVAEGIEAVWPAEGRAKALEQPKVAPYPDAKPPHGSGLGDAAKTGSLLRPPPQGARTLKEITPGPYGVRSNPATDFDVEIGSVEFEDQVLECLMTKAFCVIDAKVMDVGSHPDAWRLTASSFDPAQSAPGVSIADGLLGRDGSARIRPLELPSLTSSETQDEDIVQLVELKEQLQFFGHRLALELLGLDDAAPTVAVLHLPEQPTTTSRKHARPMQLLTDDAGVEWLQVFSRHRLMTIFFLGPGTGTLELGLFEDESLCMQRVACGSGVLVVLRPEVLSRRFVADSEDPCMALSVFMLTMRPCQGPAEPPLAPYCEALVHWLEGRMKRSGQMQDEASLEYVPSTKPEPVAEPQIFAMDHQEKQQACVVSEACKLASAWSSGVFFESVIVGADLVEQVPFCRFDVREHVDDLQISTVNGAIGGTLATCCRHGSFIEGADLFDNTCFGISTEDGHGLPPSVTSGLEVAHIAISKALGSEAIPRGDEPRVNADVLYGMHAEDNELFSRSPYAGSLGAPLMCRRVGRANAGAWADEPNRISYILGLCGRSAFFDTDGSSSFAALWRGFGDQTADEGGVFTVVLTSAWNLEPFCFNRLCRRGLLSAVGRCFCFDRSATGFVRAEGCAGIVLAKSSGQSTLSLDCREVGSVRGVALRQSGGSARLGEPAGVSMQQVMDEAVIASDVSLSDVNILEAHAPGAALLDAIEMGAVERVFPRFSEEETLPVTDVKTVLGSGFAAAGLFALLKVLCGTQRATLGGNAFLKQLNFDMRMRQSESNLTFLSEALKHPVGSTGLTCINSFGSQGTLVSAVVWADLTWSIPDVFCPEPQLSGPPPPSVSFWPAGGGELDPSEQPEHGYYISGSFCQWTDPPKMELESPGEWIATVVLGYNKWEQFQIWLDGDRRRALHPGQPKAPRQGPVFGPADAEQCAMFHWQIEGRQLKTLRRMDAADGIPLFADDETGDSWAWVDTPTRDVGEPGTRYKVRLRVAGRYRTVDWQRLPDDPAVEGGDPAVVRAVMADIVDASTKPPCYHVVANWTDWLAEPMSQDESRPWIWHLQVLLAHANGVFMIVRNRDFGQILYPEQDDEGDYTRPVLGPDDTDGGRCWMIRDALGATVHIEFSRDVGYRIDERQLRWWIEGAEGEAGPDLPDPSMGSSWHISGEVVGSESLFPEPAVPGEARSETVGSDLGQWEDVCQWYDSPGGTLPERPSTPAECALEPTD